jgi:hypothetical protein
VGWNLARESFWTNLSTFINTFKLRASYGELGNQNTYNLYPTYPVMPVIPNGGSWILNGLATTYVGTPALINPDLEWEKTRTWNVGLDLGLFNNRLITNFDYFTRFTDNMTGPGPSVPAILGTSVPPSNNTSLKTYGWDLSIVWNDLLENGFRYSAKVILSDNQTEILSYPNPSGDIYNYRNGQKVGDIWGYTTVGIAKTQEEMDAHLATTNQDNIYGSWSAGDIMYKDLNDDGKISGGAYTADDHGDLSIIGNTTPRYMLGIDLNASWKGFDFRAFIQGILKRQWFPVNNGVGTGEGTFFWGFNTWGPWNNNPTRTHLDYFRDNEDNPLGVNLDSYYPRPLFDTEKNHEVQTRYLQDASYVRLKNIQLGYTLPLSMSKKAGMQKLRIYISGENLFTVTNMSELFDPETLGTGFANGQNLGYTTNYLYPLSKVYSLGASITF